MSDVSSGAYRRALNLAVDETTKERLRKRLVIAEARDAILECTRCPLSQTRKQAVPWSGSTGCQVLVIGEAPGPEENRDGVPFTGRAGKLLDQLLRGIDLRRPDVMVMNTVSCMPTDDGVRFRPPAESERAACRVHFQTQIDLSEAWLVLVMGGVAVNALRPDLGKVPMAKLHGNPYEEQGRVWIPMYHPSWALRTGQLPLMERDFSLVKRFLDVDLVARLASGEGWGERRIKTRRALMTKLDKQGWAVTAIPKVGLITIAGHDQRRVPPDHPIWTLAEIVALRGDVEAMVAANEVKRQIGGVIVQVSTMADEE